MRDEFDEVLSDRMAAAIVTQMLPSEFQDVIMQGQGAGEVVYEAIKDKGLAWHEDPAGSADAHGCRRG